MTNDRIARPFIACGIAALTVLSIVPARAQDSLGGTGIKGAGSTFAVPGPVLGGGLPGLVMAIAGMWGWRRFRN